MFERFTDRARRVVVLAQEEARVLDHNYIGTEHLLLGLLQEREGVAAAVLDRLPGVSLTRVRSEVEQICGRGDSAPGAQIPFTPRSKKVLELSLRETLKLGHNYIGTEHILLGLMREHEGVAAQVLVKLGADLPVVRQQVIEILNLRGGEREQDPTVRFVNTATPPFGALHVRSRQVTPRLERVVPIAREVEISEWRRLVLMSLEIWSDWLDLRVTVVSGAGALRTPLGTASVDNWTLADDLGTAYQRLGTSIVGDDLFQVHQATFAPAPPSEAATLTLTLPAPGAGNEVQVVVELR
jgi:Clp amino terminal domain, pathogenicity island component